MSGSIVQGIDTAKLGGQDATTKAGSLKGWDAAKLFRALKLLGNPNGTADVLGSDPEFAYLTEPEFAEERKQLENSLYGIEQGAKQARRKLRQKSSKQIRLTAQMHAGILTVTLQHLQTGAALNIRKFITEYQPSTTARLTSDEADKLKQRLPTSDVKKELKSVIFPSKYTVLGSLTSKLTKSEQSMLLRGTLADSMKMLEVLYKQKQALAELADAQAIPLKKS